MEKETPNKMNETGFSEIESLTTPKNLLNKKFGFQDLASIRFVTTFVTKPIDAKFWSSPF